MKSEDLKSLRKKIDEIDRELVNLLSERLGLAEEILKLKKEGGLEVRNKAREQKIIERARERARERDLDPEFVEDLMRLTIAKTAGVEREQAGEPWLWERVRKAFANNPAQLKVAEVLLKYGLRVTESGDVTCGDIRVPAVQIAEEAGVDRRAVDSTAETVSANEELRGIFSSLRPVPFLKGVAQQLGLGVIEILPTDAKKPGIIRDVSGVISKFGVSIRQSFTDDPYFVGQPKLTIITGEPLSGDIIEALRDLPSVESVVIY